MSAEAQAAVLAAGEELTLGQFAVMTVLANRADERGIVSDYSLEDLAARCPLTKRGIQNILGEVAARGCLHVLQKGSGRGNLSTYQVVIPGEERMKLPDERVKEPDGKVEVARPNGAPKDAPSEAVESKEVQSVNQSARARQAEFAEELRDAEVPDQLLADGKALLREGRKVDGKLVTGREMAVAVAGLAEFNRRLERDFGVGANLTSIVMRARDRPSWAPADHVRLVGIACEDPWWERRSKSRRPTPNVIWGDRSFENVVQDAADRKAGKGPKRYRGRTR
jgi:hypothetical protein